MTVSESRQIKFADLDLNVPVQLIKWTVRLPRHATMSGPAVTSTVACLLGMLVRLQKCDTQDRGVALTNMCASPDIFHQSVGLGFVSVFLFRGRLQHWKTL